MCCRCFTGDYRPYEDGRKRRFSPATGLLVLALLAYVYLFIRLEGVLS